MPTAYGYTRYSTQKQNDSNLVKANEDQITAYFAYRFKPQNVAWGGMYIDKAVSGMLPFQQRPCGQAITYRVASGDHIIFADLDRGFRGTIDCLTTIRAWIDRDISPHFLKYGLDPTTPMGKFGLTMMVALAELERDRVSERTRESFMAMKTRGLRVTRDAGMGFRWVGEGIRSLLEPDHDHDPDCAHSRWANLQIALNLYDQGLGFAAISRELAARGDRVNWSRIRTAVRFHHNVVLRRASLGIQPLPDMPGVTSVCPPLVRSIIAGSKVRLLHDLLTRGGTKFSAGSTLYVSGRYHDETCSLETEPDKCDGPLLVPVSSLESIA